MSKRGARLPSDREIHDAVKVMRDPRFKRMPVQKALERPVRPLSQALDTAMDLNLKVDVRHLTVGELADEVQEDYEDQVEFEMSHFAGRRMTFDQAVAELRRTRELSTGMLDALGIPMDQFLRFAQLPKAKADRVIDKMIGKFDTGYRPPGARAASRKSMSRTKRARTPNEREIVKAIRVMRYPKYRRNKVRDLYDDAPPDLQEALSVAINLGFEYPDFDSWTYAEFSDALEDALQEELSGMGVGRYARRKWGAHHFDGSKWYVDTAFINAVQHVYPGGHLRHMGFGEFVLDTPDGRLDFDRMRGKNFPGQSGRSHQIYDDAKGKVVEKAIMLMEKAKKSEKMAATRTPTRTAMPNTLRTKLIRLAFQRPELREDILPLLKRAANELPQWWDLGPAYGALTFASGELLDQGREREAQLATKIKMMIPEGRATGTAIAREMHKKFHAEMPDEDSGWWRMAGRSKRAARPIHEIAREIARDWRPVNYAAKPYLEAMFDLDDVTDSYGYDSAPSIIRYFLSNSRAWRGPVAKAIKAELNAMVKGRYGHVRGGRRVAPRSKVGSPVALHTFGLDVQAARSGMGAMLYAIYPPGHPKAKGKKGHSKFYEMMIVPEGGGYKLMRAWGALTDRGTPARLDRADNFFDDLGQAKRALKAIYKKRLSPGHDYTDAFDPSQHVSPDGRKLPSGRYPVGLARDPGFGWGTQEMAWCTPALREIEKLLGEAQGALDDMQFQDASNILNQVSEIAGSQLGKDDSTMAAKIRDNIAHMQGRAAKLLAGEIDRSAIRNWRTALSRLISFIDKQLSVCH